MGWQLLNQKETSKPAPEEDLDNLRSAIEEKAFYPFTFPLTVGPGGMAVVLTFSAHLNRESRLLVTIEQGAAVIGILLMCVVVTICYRNLNYMTKRFSAVGALALRGVAIFAKDFSGHPARKNRQKCTRPLMPSAAPIRPRHLVSTQQGVET
jgi:multiple antibiotic resistance protein